MTLPHEVAMPAQHGVRLDQQPQAAQDLARQRGEERGKDDPVLLSEVHLALAELPFKDVS
ncbi:hypothetical protein [Kitasatospora kifunensis]|uniref:Uncharacterized protein n=1 Tax=Kitasatospora kifunensis TaxID=58351 RepID=A0A7W7VT88_KITKI|nr:hypothetical protein [Kitasatospora kifunensis]MBB4921957.1 hypothetical protein [Kitasatospora kifunensis]